MTQKASCVPESAGIMTPHAQTSSVHIPHTVNHLIIRTPNPGSGTSVSMSELHHGRVLPASLDSQEACMALLSRAYALVDSFRELIEAHGNGA